MRYTYHDLMVRAQPDSKGDMKAYIRHMYKFNDEVVLDYFYIEALEDGSTIACEFFNASYGLSSSLDKVTWTALTGSTVATGVQAGAKVYLRGDTSTLGSTLTGPGCRFYSNNAFRAGGSVLSLYSPTLEPKELTNGNDLAYFFWTNKIRECLVDFGPVRSTYHMFSGCSSLSALPDGFSIPNATNTEYMFSSCSSLSALPDGFSIPNATNTAGMFDSCSSLSRLPDGFSIQNATDAGYMFCECTKLSELPEGFSCPNVTNAYSMFNGCSSLSSLPDGFSAPNVTDANSMFYRCSSLSAIGNNVKVANGTGATSTDDTDINKSQITSIGDSFEWFTNAAYEGEWDPALGIRNVFPNATSVGSGWRVYNHYDGEASGEAPSNLDYFYIEPTEDNATVVCENLDQSYNLSYSLDKSSWTALTGGAQASTYSARSASAYAAGQTVVAEGLPSGAKVYLKGDTSTLGSWSEGPGCRFYSNGAFNAGGKALSLYSPALEPKTLTNANDLAYFFSGCETLSRCSVDFGPVRSASSMFSYCSNLKELPAGFSVPNLTGAAWMFDNCTGLSALPEGFSVPNVADTSHMFSNCYSLLALPEGFSAPDATGAASMFAYCSSLSGLPDGFSAPNVRDVASMFVGCTSLRSIGNGVKVANGPNAASANDTGLDLSQITSIGDNFEWFTNATFNGEWDYSLGIRNVFPNAATVGSGWQVYGHTASEAPAPSGADLDYFYIMPLADGADAVCENFSPSYNLSYSLDKSAWRPLTGSLIASDVRAGTKVYLKGDTSTLGSWSEGPGCRFFVDGGNFSAGGSVLSLYSPTLEQKALTNEYDLAYFFWTKGIRECSVDFGPVRCASSMFEDCGALMALPDGFSVPNMTDTGQMFSYCYGLSELPDGFSIPNVTGAVRMFSYCSSLSSLPEGFSAPNVTNAKHMFEGCSSLSSLPAGFSCPKATDTNWMFYNCSSLSALPDGFSAPNVTTAYSMFYNCASLTRIGNNVKVANGAGAASTDGTEMDKSRITSIGNNFEWFTNVTYQGYWDPGLGIRNVFPNATSVGSGWRVYDHYDGEGSGGSGGSGSGADLDYFYIEPLQDDATAVANGFSSSYRLSSSLDKKTWTALTGGGAITSGVPAGTKVYLRGDTSTLSSTSDGGGCKFYFYADEALKAFKAGGSALSLYSPTLEPKELTNENDLAHFFSFYSKEIRECSVDFGPVRSAYCMFYQCAYLSALPDGFSIPNVTNASHMFYDCKNLSSLPAGFSIPNVKNADSMFCNCWSLSSLPDGFSAPNVTFAPDMFRGCYKLSVIGNNVKVANGAGATSTDYANINNLITSIGDNFEWFTNAVYEGDWDPALGIRNVFPNATSVGSGWRVYNHYDGE